MRPSPLFVRLLLSCSALTPFSAALAESAVEPLGMAALMRMTGGLALVVALVFAAAWAVRRFGRLPTAHSGNLRLLGGLAVGQRERVVLVQVGGRQLVLGVAPGQVSLLHALDGEACPAQPPAPAAAPATGAAFQDRLRALLRREGEQ